MEARFVFIHPDDPGEILLATSLIRCVKRQVEGAQVYSLVREDHSWLLESNPFLDEIFPFREQPGELSELIRDFLPDYLIDLDGSRRVKRFKSEVKVLDFTLKRRWTTRPWRENAFATCRLFDVTDDGVGPDLIVPPLDPRILPSEFLDGYIALSLESAGKPGLPVTESQVVELAVMIEKPIVVTGSQTERGLANRIGQLAGCAVFPVCGDLSPSQTASVVAGAEGVVLFDSFWDQVAAALGKKKIFIGSKGTPPNLVETALWARSLIKTSHDRDTL